MLLSPLVWGPHCILLVDWRHIRLYDVWHVVLSGWCSHSDDAIVELGCRGALWCFITRLIPYSFDMLHVGLLALFTCLVVHMRALCGTWDASNRTLSIVCHPQHRVALIACCSDRGDSIVGLVGSLRESNHEILPKIVHPVSLSKPVKWFVFTL